MTPIYFLYVSAGLAGLGLGSQVGPESPAWMQRLIASGALLVTGLVGVATLFAGPGGGPVAAIGWLLLGWTVGVWLQGHR